MSWACFIVLAVKTQPSIHMCEVRFPLSHFAHTYAHSLQLFCSSQAREMLLGRIGMRWGRLSGLRMENWDMVYDLCSLSSSKIHTRAFSSEAASLATQPMITGWRAWRSNPNTSGEALHGGNACRPLFLHHLSFHSLLKPKHSHTHKHTHTYRDPHLASLLMTCSTNWTMQDSISSLSGHRMKAPHYLVSSSCGWRFGWLDSCQWGRNKQNEEDKNLNLLLWKGYFSCIW